MPVTKVLSERAVIQTVFQRKLGISGDDPVECGTSPFPVTLPWRNWMTVTSRKNTKKWIHFINLLDTHWKFSSVILNVMSKTYEDIKYAFHKSINNMIENKTAQGLLVLLTIQNHAWTWHLVTFDILNQRGEHRGPLLNKKDVQRVLLYRRASTKNWWSIEEKSSNTCRLKWTYIKKIKKRPLLGFHNPPFFREVCWRFMSLLSSLSITGWQLSP